MTKEDKQIIERATKEEWRIGDRTRLKHLLKKNLKQYRDNVELKNKNKLLGERCNQLLKDKGDLTDKIADIKANCDLAIEGRDVEIMELKKENEELKKRVDNLYNSDCWASDQLTKAKELLMKWVELFKPKGGNIPPTPIQVDTEQFLKEGEKCRLQKQFTKNTKN